MKNKYLCLLFLLFSLVSMSAHAQIKVEGNVFDENDTPLIGVSVVAEGGTNGAITDLNGHFSLMVSNANSYLTFSYVGYITQKVQLKGKKLLKIILREDANLLDEVVVVGYGTQKKINVTGAIAQVDNKELKMAPSGSLSGMLAGRLPGLISKQSSGQPGADGANLYIRGNGAGDGSPLIVIDGVITDYFPSFSPDEVESITILKDATAAAVYGVRAAAGVILITTKRGAVQKPTVTYNGSLTLSQNTDFPKFLNGPDYAYWYNKAQLLDGVAEENLRFSPEEIDRITNPGENEHIYGNTDWFDLLFRNTAPTYTNNVSVSGGTEKIKFFASVGAYNQGLGYAGIVCGFCIMCFYFVLGGIVLRYAVGYFLAIFGGSEFAWSGQGTGFFGYFLTDTNSMILFFVLYILLNILVVSGGVQGGIEKFCNVGMPALFCLLVFIILYIACQPGAAEGYKFMFSPDFSVFSNPEIGFGRVLKNAAGQMFFSLSIGLGVMITYGSYLGKQEHLQRNAFIVCGADTLIALMAGMAVMPACAAFGVEYGAGPGLLFASMQTVFSHMGSVGNLIGFLFYLLVLIAALTSSISMLELCTAYAVDKQIDKGLTPKRAKHTASVAALVFVAGSLVALDGLGANGLFRDCNRQFHHPCGRAGRRGGLPVGPRRRERAAHRRP